MSAEKTEIETFFGKCRCCLSYGYLKNMWEEHHFKGEAEIYGEMLVQCFALTWDQSEDAMEQDQICEQCISRLRDANDFKKVVLDSQEELLQQIDAENVEAVKDESLEEEYLIEFKHPESEADTIYADTEYTMDTADTALSVKDEPEYEEIEYLEEETGGTIDDAQSDFSEQSEQKTPVKRRKQPRQPDTDDEDGPKRKWPKKLPKSERQKTYKQYSESDLRKCLEEVRNNLLTAGDAALKYNIPKKTICAKIKMGPKDVPNDNTTTINNIKKGRKVPTTSEIDAIKVTETSLREAELIENKSDDQRFMYKHKANLKAILQNSNATLIKSYGRDGFSCNFCDFQAKIPRELKMHNLKRHANVGDGAIKTKYVTDLIIKLDMTDFKCKLCKESINTLEEFMAHLSSKHSKYIYNDVKNYIIPFKFDSKDFRCFICNKHFKYFKLLSEHMTEHYRNFNCPVCDRSFINKQSMQTHTYRHKRGTFKCSYCSKEFDTRPKRTDHERIVHVVAGRYRKCAYCDERFSNWDCVVDHEFKAHGVARPTHTCDECGKSCNSQTALTTHKNRFHLLKKPHKCSSCEMAFCTKIELSYHTITHTKTRNYNCKICKKAFGTPITLNQHMRTHVGIKKFLCDYCDRRFLHRTTFRRHMKDMHGDIV